MITMGSMSRAIKEQKIVGLDPRKKLFTPLDLVAAGGAIKVAKGYQTFRTAVPVMNSQKLTFGYRLGIPSAVGVHNLARRQVIEGGRDILKGMGIMSLGIVSRSVYPKLIEKHSRGRGQSLTSGPRTPRQPQPKRNGVSAGKRTLSPRLSKGDKVNVRARRRTTYCNLHKKYDFCEYYKK